MPYKFQPGMQVIVRADAPEFANDVLKLERYIGNNTWIVRDSANCKHFIKEKYFYGDARTTTTETE